MPKRTVQVKGDYECGELIQAARMVSIIHHCNSTNKASEEAVHREFARHIGNLLQTHGCYSSVDGCIRLYVEDLARLLEFAAEGTSPERD